MADVFIHVNPEKAHDVTECGLKLSENSSVRVVYRGSTLDCILAFLHPLDDPAAEGGACLRLHVIDQNCIIGDGMLRKLQGQIPEAAERYHESLTPYEEYKIGTYRYPEVLVRCSLLSSQLFLQGSRLDVPMLYGSSGEAYTDNLFGMMADAYDSFKEDALYSFFMMLYQNGNFDGIVNEYENEVVFVSKKAGKVYSFKRPTFEKY